MRTSGDAVLEVQALTSGYGATTVLFDVDLMLRPGEAIAVLGANGVGKSTLLRTLSGILSPRHGAISLDGRSIIGRSPDRVARHGMSLVPEGRALFPAMSVADNLRLGSFAGPTPGTVDLDQIFAYFPMLAAKADVAAGSLSGGEQQLVAIARALVVPRRVLMLDEPSLGLSPRATGEVLDIVRGMVTEGLSVIVAEQDVRAAMRLADRAVVLRNGRIAASIKGGGVFADRDALRSVYL